jgi:hypothetical protein
MERAAASAVSATFALADNAAEPLIVGVFAAPDDIPVDHAGLSF